MKLFPRDRVVGIFRGFSEGGLEFHADLVLPYRNEFQSTPMHGQFLVVQLEHEDEAVLGRISSISAMGRLASGAGEDYGIRAMADDRPIPEDLREQYLKYQINIRVLGVLRLVDGKLEYAASHRRLPHVGSKVAFLAEDVLKEVSGHNNSGADVGFFALGEFIYSGADARLDKQAWMQVKQPGVVVKFDASHLVSRRSFVFARAGFGKSNLVKLLFSNLYKGEPAVEKRMGKRVPVGTLIFDPDGEYYWPDDKNRPGLCDVPELKNKVVVFTAKQPPSAFYGSFVAGPIKLDIRRLRPADVISIALPPERQDQQNVGKLKGMNKSDWHELVDLIYSQRNAADPESIKKLLRLDDKGDVEMVAARSNMTKIVAMLHDPSSQLMDMLLLALKAGKLCVVDVSQMRGAPALILSGLILQRIFDHNQDEFTKAAPETIPTIAVVEEAQSVLGSGGSSGEGPYVTWVKEGRKYDLGAVLITQQPGSISHEILSQGDNWFIFHLLSAGDLVAVKKANAHFSDDILSALLNEPIVGHGVYWSSAGGRSYPVPIRVLSFEQSYKALDPAYKLPAVETYAKGLKSKFDATIASSATVVPVAPEPTSDTEGPIEVTAESPPDAYATHIATAIGRLRQNPKIMAAMSGGSVPWMEVQTRLKEALPAVIDTSERDQMAHDNVPKVLNELAGAGRWKTERRPKKSGQGVATWIVTTPAAA